MKKTFTINISGIIFHIDDDAYTKLNAYIANIKRHFNNFDGKDEVIADIESRIAEILQSKLKDTKEVIVIADIDDVVSTMGQPSDFTEDEEEENKEYHNNSSSSYKRLYRDPENKVIGGVASGISAYLHLDPVWVRLAFILLIFTSLGIPIYIILWIAVPDAISASDRLQMKGEKINISNIEKSVKEEFDSIKEKFNDFNSKEELDSIKEKFNDFKSQAKETYKKQSEIPKTFFEDVLGVFKDIFSFIGKGIVIFFGIILLIIGFSLTVGFLAGTFGWTPFMIDDPNFIVSPLNGMFEFFLSSSTNTGLLKLGLFFFVGIPVLMILYAGIRIIFGFERIKGLGSTAFALWMVGLALCAVFSYKISNNFRYEGRSVTKIQIDKFEGNTIKLKVGDEALFDNNFFQEIIEIDNFEVIKMNHDYYMNEVHLDITESDNDQISLTIHANANGRTYNIADRNAKEIEYGFKQERNTFYFDEFLKLPREIPYLDQSIWLEFKVPVGYNIDMDLDFHKLIDHYRYYRYHRRYNRYYKMTIDGLEKIEEIIDETIDDIGKREKSIYGSAFSKLGFSMFNHIYVAL